MCQVILLIVFLVLLSFSLTANRHHCLVKCNVNLQLRGTISNPVTELNLLNKKRLDCSANAFHIIGAHGVLLGAVVLEIFNARVSYYEF